MGTRARAKSCSHIACNVCGACSLYCIPARTTPRRARRSIGLKHRALASPSRSAFGMWALAVVEIDTPWWWAWAWVIAAVLLFLASAIGFRVGGRVGQPHRGRAASPPADASPLAFTRPPAPSPPTVAVPSQPAGVDPQLQPCEVSSETSREDDDASSSQEEEVGVHKVGTGGYPVQVQQCAQEGHPSKRQYNAPAKGGVRALYRICDCCGSRWMLVGERWIPIAPRPSPHARSPPGPEPSGAVAHTTAWTGRPAVAQDPAAANQGTSASTATRAPRSLRSRVFRASRLAQRRQAAAAEGGN